MGQVAEKLGQTATADVRRALLDQLELLPGQAVVMRRRSEEGGDTLLVRLAPGIKPGVCPNRFRGIEVAYEAARPPRAGRW